MSAVKAVHEVRGVLIPCGSLQLLLPNAAVAEVTDYRQPTPLSGERPGWLLGTVAWRQRSLLVLDPELLLGGSVREIGGRARIAVCNTLSPDATRPFLGLLCRRIPRLVRVTEEALEPLSAPEGGDALPVHHWVRVRDEQALIPDLDRLQELVASA